MLASVSAMRLFDITETTEIAQPSIKHNGQFNTWTKLTFTFTSCAKVGGDGDEMEYICNNSHYMKTFAFTDSK